MHGTLGHKITGILFIVFGMITLVNAALGYNKLPNIDTYLCKHSVYC